MTDQERFDFIVRHVFGGWHHVGTRKEHSGPGWTAVVFTYCGDVSTYDSRVLTDLVLAAHAVRIRVELTNGGPYRLKVALSTRGDKPDDWSRHHPSLDDLIESASKLSAELRGK